VDQQAHRPTGAASAISWLTCLTKVDRLRYGHGRPHDPAQAIPAAARYLIDHGARRNLDRAIFAYNHSRSYVAKVKQLAHRYGRGGGRP
jgi:membrane-bound lytic murein transglycosylase B